MQSSFTSCLTPFSDSLGYFFQPLMSIYFLFTIQNSFQLGLFGGSVHEFYLLPYLHVGVENYQLCVARDRLSLFTNCEITRKPLISGLLARVDDCQEQETTKGLPTGNLEANC